MKPDRKPVPDPDHLMTAREAVAYLRISLSTLHRMEQRGQIHALRTPGGHRRYTLRMLCDCLAQAGGSGETTRG